MPMLAGIPMRPPAVLGRRCPRDEWAPTSHAFAAAARTVPNGADKAMAGLVASAVSRRSHRRLPHCARENPHGASEPRGEVQCKPALPPPSALAALSHAEATPASSYGADADAASRIAQTGAPLRVRCGTALRSVFATKAHPMLLVGRWSLHPPLVCRSGRGYHRPVPVPAPVPGPGPGPVPEPVPAPVPTGAGTGTGRYRWGYR